MAPGDPGAIGLCAYWLGVAGAGGTLAVAGAGWTLGVALAAGAAPLGAAEADGGEMYTGQGAYSRAPGVAVLE
jgi:hypothetical protein